MSGSTPMGEWWVEEEGEMCAVMGGSGGEMKVASSCDGDHRTVRDHEVLGCDLCRSEYVRDGAGEVRVKEDA